MDNTLVKKMNLNFQNSFQ